ncbi:MAG TPA: EamA family transporter [Candidatus Dormibacteraeota bacterium]|nr:EamA family transporter [Candidatus Dormibacteraeota bacterium]
MSRVGRIERHPPRAVILSSVGVIVALWSLNFIAAKIGLRNLSALTMASFRVVLAGLIMVPLYLACRRFQAFAPAPGRRVVRFTYRDIWTFTYLGFFGVAINQVCFTAGLRYTSVGHSAIIVAMGPIFVLLLSGAIGLERLTVQKIIGMGIAFAGVLCIATERASGTSSSKILGDAITLSGSLGFALYAVLAKRVAADYDTLTMNAFTHFTGMILVLPLACFEAWRIGAAANWSTIGWQSWAATAYMAVFGSAIAYLLYFWLLRYMLASRLSAFSYLLPVVGTILGIWLLGEKATWNQVLGGGLVLAGIYWVESGRKPEPVRTPAR